MANLLQTIQTGEKKDLATMLKALDAECRNCAPTSPLECINRCQVYKLKNELRTLATAMDTPNYTKELFNVLKNETRLHILKAIAEGKYSVSQLQQELKKNGYSHSQDTINEEYLQPLMSLGLAMESCEQYYATQFGGRLTKTLKGKVAATFGSYGWSGEAPKMVQDIMTEQFGMQAPMEPLLAKYIPDQAALDASKDLGRKIAETLMNQA